jgi:ABC-2 type transport system permease protein
MLRRELKKYLAVFKLSWQNVLEYRFNFIMWRVRSFVFLLTMYFLWTTVFAGKQALFGFNREQIVTYVLLSVFLFSLVFIYAMDSIADSIANGSLSLFLVKPISFLTYWFVRFVARRFLNTLLTVVELVIFLFLVKPQFFVQKDPRLITYSFFAAILAVILLSLMDFIFGLTSFWTLHAYGPRFALKTLMEFASGSFFPLNILPMILFKTVSFLPFALLVFFPLRVFLGQLTLFEVYRGLLTQLIWIAVLFVALRFVWNRGLRRYEAVGG